MSRNPVWLKLSLVLVMLSPAGVMAQGGDSANVTNIHFESLGDRISISYDLQGSPDDEYRVTVSLRKESDPSFRHSLMRISGDAGAGIFAGMYKKILWDIKAEFPEGLPGEDYYFVVNAYPVASSGPSALLWVGVGVAALGGVATYFLLQHSGDTPAPAPAASGFPAPPGRP